MESLLAPQWPLVFFESVKFHPRGFFTHYLEYEVGFGPKFRGTDGKPTNTICGLLVPISLNRHSRRSRFVLDCLYGNHRQDTG